MMVEMVMYLSVANYGQLKAFRWALRLIKGTALLKS